MMDHKAEFVIRCKTVFPVLKVPTVKGFTLVELLVVISVIALLTSVLLPALSRARDKSRAIYCANSLKQIGVAEMCYVDGERYFTPRQPVSGSSWVRTLMLEGYVQHNIALAALSGKQYIDPVSTLFLCPSSLSPAECYSWDEGEQPKWGAMNYAINVQTEKLPVSRIKFPSQKMLLLEENNYWTYYDRCDNTAASTSRTLLHKHNKKVNVLFTDGHVAPVANLELPRNYIDGVNSQVGSYYEIKRFWDYSSDL